IDDNEWTTERWKTAHIPKFISELRQQKREKQIPIWTHEEKQNFAHFYRSRRAFDEAAELIGSLSGTKGAERSERIGNLIVALRAARGEAKSVREEVMARAHPELPSAFNDTYMLCL